MRDTNECVMQVMEDVTEFVDTGDGIVKKKLDQILLNGNNICMLVPGSNGPEESGPQPSS